MITIPKKVEYCVELISYLSGKSGKTVSVTEAAERLKLPYRFLSQLAGKLKTENILESREGKSGGYTLMVGWNKKSMYELLAALGEDKHMVKCLDEDSVCGRQKQCRMRKVWKRIESKLVTELKEIKLGEI